VSVSEVGCLHASGCIDDAAAFGCARTNGENADSAPTCQSAAMLWMSLFAWLINPVGRPAVARPGAFCYGLRSRCP